MVQFLIKNLPVRFRRKIRIFIAHYINSYRVKGKTKIFCIGQNKTGTTSLKQAFIDLGYVVGEQREAEKLLPYYRDKNFYKIIAYCKTAQVFQDFPFSYPETYKYLDVAYPGSKFILTVRDSPLQWYDSVLKFESKVFGKGKVPTKADLQNTKYVWQGWVWQCRKLLLGGAPDDNPYCKEAMIKSYVENNQAVIDYFRDRPDDLIVINVSENEGYKKLMKFLKIKSPFTRFPWKNKTSDLIKNWLILLAYFFSFD